MKKIYVLVLMSFGIGILSAQNAKINKQGESKTKVATSSVNPKETVAQDAALIPNTAISKDEIISNESNSNGTVTVNKNVDGKVVLTKEDFDKQSDRGKEHILAHPELYTVEQ
jgi:hypothetical protein